ncbi:MAG TPA: hypothetical protein VF752_17225 [Thermoleophilaceae bacterium]
MARVLVVGCGCRGLELARALAADGHAVRGTTRRQERLPEIEAAGAQAALADPDRLATMLPHIDGVAVMCWIMGSASGEPDHVAALHGPRLESMVETLVDTHVRGVVYEAAGSVDQALLEHGAASVRMAGARFHMPVEVVDTDPRERTDWLEAMRAAVARVLAA